LRHVRLPPAAEPHWSGLVSTCERLRMPSSDWPRELGDVLAWYEPHLVRLYDDSQSRAADLVQLSRIAATFGTRERFLTEITLDPPSSTSGRADTPSQDDDYLVLSTIHSAKGQEWRSVHVINVVDGCIPSDMAAGRGEDVEEERRLLYVAITRARDRLAIVVPQRFYVTAQSRTGDRHAYALRSRFLTAAVCDMFEQISWAPADSKAAAPVRGGALLDLSRQIRDAWNAR
jgi:DNA helicase-2/ATP-dependent DNA helicase PcrA